MGFNRRRNGKDNHGGGRHRGKGKGKGHSHGRRHGGKGGGKGRSRGKGKGGGYNWRKHLPDGHPMKEMSTEAWRNMSDDQRRDMKNDPERQRRMQASREERRTKKLEKDAAVISAAGLTGATLGADLDAAQRAAAEQARHDAARRRGRRDPAPELLWLDPRTSRRLDMACARLEQSLLLGAEKGHPKEEPGAKRLRVDPESAGRSGSTSTSSNMSRSHARDIIRDACDGRGHFNRHRGAWGVVKGALAAGLFPNLVRVDPKSGPQSAASRRADWRNVNGSGKGFRFFAKEHGAVKPHPGSVNDKTRNWEHKWLIYFDKVETLGGLFIYDSTEVAPVPLLLFGGTAVPSPPDPQEEEEDADAQGGGRRGRGRGGAAAGIRQGGGGEEEVAVLLRMTRTGRRVLPKAQFEAKAEAEAAAAAAAAAERCGGGSAVSGPPLPPTHSDPAVDFVLKFLHAQPGHEFGMARLSGMLKRTYPQLKARIGSIRRWVSDHESDGLELVKPAGAWLVRWTPATTTTSSSSMDDGAVARGGAGASSFSAAAASSSSSSSLGGGGGTNDCVYFGLDDHMYFEVPDLKAPGGSQDDDDTKPKQGRRAKRRQRRAAAEAAAAGQGGASASAASDGGEQTTPCPGPASNNHFELPTASLSPTAALIERSRGLLSAILGRRITHRRSSRGGGRGARRHGASTDAGGGSATRRSEAEAEALLAAKNAGLLAQHRARVQSRACAAMLSQRQRLPSFSMRDKIVSVIAAHAVTVVSGETGCGKTTQVPQFILDAMTLSARGAACNIVCTQPRRISAIGVAERVAEERGFTTKDLGRRGTGGGGGGGGGGGDGSGGGSGGGIGGGIGPCDVGYQIRLERRATQHTRLLFCTTGILLRRLQNDPTLESVSHVILDEVHERSIDSDFLLVILRDLQTTRRPDLKIVLMSATLDAEYFADYFAFGPAGDRYRAAKQRGAAARRARAEAGVLGSGDEGDVALPPAPPVVMPVPVVHIPGFTFPVEEFFLEDAVEATGVSPIQSGGGGGGGRGGGRRGGGGGRRRRGGGGGRAASDAGNALSPSPEWSTSEAEAWRGRVEAARQDLTTRGYSARTADWVAPWCGTAETEYRLEHEARAKAEATAREEAEAKAAAAAAAAAAQSGADGVGVGVGDGSAAAALPPPSPPPLSTFRRRAAVDRKRDLQFMPIPVSLIVALLHHIETISARPPPSSPSPSAPSPAAAPHDLAAAAAAGAVLIFLPGWDDITKVCDALKEAAPARAGKWAIHPLHGSLPTAQQRAIFRRPPRGVRKVVVATNIAESSITIDDVVYVIDCGKHKEKSYDATRQIGLLLPTFVSRASAKQRRGRAGRVRAGVCWHLFPRSQLAQLRPYQLPEIVRTPLEQLCLTVRALELASPGRGGVAAFLGRAVTPPAPIAMDVALSTLRRIGALRAADEGLTPLGWHLAALPMEPRIGKALVYSALLGCVEPMLTICAVLSHRSPFVLPLDNKASADRAKLRLSRGEASDHRAMLEAYDGYVDALARGGRKAGDDFCWDNFLSGATLRMVTDMRRQFAELMHEAGLLDDSTAADGGGGGAAAANLFLDAICSCLIDADELSGLA